MTSIISIHLKKFSNWAKGLLGKHTIFRQATVICLMGILLWLIYLAASWGFADFLAGKVHHTMQQWETQEELTTEAWQSTHATLARARYFDTHHPSLSEATGQSYYLLSNSNTITPAEKLMALQQALDYYLKAAKQKTASSYTWANIAIVKARLGQYDAQLLEALEYATLLGPWEPFVQRAVVDVGLAAWYRFPKEKRKKGRQIVFEAIERGMQKPTNKQAGLMGQLIKRHQREWVICAYSGTTGKIADFCQSIGR